MQHRNRQRSVPKPSDRIPSNPPKIKATRAGTNDHNNPNSPPLRNAKFRCGSPTPAFDHKTQMRRERVGERSSVIAHKSKQRWWELHDATRFKAPAPRSPSLPRHPLPVTARHDPSPIPLSSLRSLHGPFVSLRSFSFSCIIFNLEGEQRTPRQQPRP